MAKFSEFVSSNEYKKQDETVNETVENLMEKYSTYSESELLNEFLKESVKKRENGELDDEQMDKIRRLLSPYLSGEQSEKLDELFRIIK